MPSRPASNLTTVKFVYEHTPTHTRETSLMPDSNVTITGNTIANTTQRAFTDCGRAGGGTVTLFNGGPAVLEHSANQDGSSATTIAVRVTGNLTLRRWLRSLGTSNVTVVTAGGGIEGVIV